MLLSSEVSSSNRCAVVPELSRDHGARFFIERALSSREISATRAAGKRCLPAREFLIAALGVGMPEAVRISDPRIADLAVVTMELRFVVLIRRDQRAALGEFSDVPEELPLLVVPDRHGSGAATLGPAGFELDVIVLDRVVG